VGTQEISAREISSCYEEDDPRCRNLRELRASREHRGSIEGATRERCGNHKDLKARISKETPESRNQF